MKFILKHFGKIMAEHLLEDGREYFIGRHEKCDFVLQGETGLSRKHVKIYQSEETGHWIVESVSEWGGLYLDGEEIESVELVQTCSLVLKNYVLDFVEEKTPEEKIQKEDNQEKEESVFQSVNPFLGDKKEDTFNEGTKILSASSLIYSLYVYIEEEMSDHISLNEGQNWIIGRSEDCDISIDYNILTRKHLQISKADGKFYIKDLGSANKTFLNGCELTPHKETLLRPSDEISVSDLKMVFEVRQRDYEQLMSSLPALQSEDSGDLENLPEMVLSKVVLEDAPPEEEEKSSKKPKFLNKKRIILFVLPIVVGIGLYFKSESDKKAKQALMEQQKSREQEDKLEVFYREALVNLEELRYQLCIDQLVELHQVSPSGYYKDSQQILISCQNGLERQRQKEEYLVREKLEKETEAKIKEIVNECKKQFAGGKIQTVEDLDQCAAELLGGLDPTNAEIFAIRMEIEEKANLKLLEEKRRATYGAKIQRKKALYSKAKKIRDQDKPLKAIEAYNVFLKSARKVSSLKELYNQAETERNEIQKQYSDRLNALYKSCESLIQQKKMKEAYYDCKKILLFKSDDKKAKKFIELVQLTIRKELKPLYEKSVEDESFSRIEEAKKLWKEILDRDVKDGYYYKKASAQIKKYR